MINTQSWRTRSIAQFFCAAEPKYSRSRTSIGYRRAISNVLSLEQNLYNLVGPALQARGHSVRPVNGGAVGGYQGILFTRDPSLPLPTYGPESIAEDQPVNGVYRAGSDHRKDGQAVGW